MKKLLNVLPGAIAGILGVLLLAGCFNQFSPAPAPTVSGQGRVTVHIGDGNSRTLLPQAPVFSRYELQFTPGSGQAAKASETVTGASPTVTLAAGDWTITAIAYVNISGVADIPGGEYEAARGSNSLTVLAEQNNSAGIDIRGGVETGKGIFSYTLSYPAAIDSAALKILTLAGAATKEVNLKESGASGSFALDTGYYILRLELEKDGGKIVKVEVIHIYKNMTTAAEGTDYTFTDADFLFAVDTDATVTAGTMTPYIAGGLVFNMAAVPGRITFPTGTDDSGTAAVRTPYQIAETEVTWELWDTVRTWALANGYSNISPGRQGSSGSGSNQQPVTMATWYSMAVWCNALTEWWTAETGASLAPVYNSGGSPIRNANDTAALDNVTPTPNARGFRLPTSNEWELAARWQGQIDRGNSVERNGYYFTRGNSASGAASNVDDNAATGNVAVYRTSGTAEVKTKDSNGLALYDMSGNVWEWNLGSAFRGGSYHSNEAASYVRLGHIEPIALKSQVFPNVGFRLARTGYKAGEIVPPSEINVPITINFAGPEDENVLVGISGVWTGDEASYITHDPSYDPSIPVLTNGTWYDDQDPMKQYQFYVKQGADYQIKWNDSYQGSGKSCDVKVSASYKSTGTNIFSGVDSGWNTPQSFTANQSGIILVTVDSYFTDNRRFGTFAVMYAKTAEGSIPFTPPLGDTINQTDTLVLHAPAGYAAYRWIVDNANAGSAGSLTLQGSALAFGPHSVTLVIYKQEGSVQVPYSKTLTFTVEP